MSRNSISQRNYLRSRKEVARNKWWQNKTNKAAIYNKSKYIHTQPCKVATLSLPTLVYCPVMGLIHAYYTVYVQVL